MTCTTIEGDLIPFHMGSLGGEQRIAVEEHLRTCASCLQAYFEVKRAIEGAGSPVRRPSAALRMRLRADVAATYARPRRRLGVWAVAASLAVATVLGLLQRRVAPELVSAQVDSARAVDAPIAFY